MAAFGRAEAKGLIPATDEELNERLYAAEDVIVALLELDCWKPEHRDEYQPRDAMELAVDNAIDRWMVFQ